MQQETRKGFRLLLLILFILLPAFSFACDVCGCFIGILPYDNQSSFGFDHRYRIFNGYSGTTSTVFPTGAYRLSSPSALHGGHMTTTLSPSDFESYKVYEFHGKWFIHPDIELNVFVPYVDNRSNYSGAKTEVSGFGDMIFLAGYHLINPGVVHEFRHRLVAGGGIKLPTGNYQRLNGSEERIPLMMQAGTGSFDVLAYIAYTGGGHNFRWGMTATSKFNSANKLDEKLSPGFSSNLFFGYLLSHNKFRFMPSVHFYQEYMKGLWEGVSLMPGSEMNSILGGPETDFYYKNFMFSCGMDMCCYEKTADDELKNKARLTATLTWSFNQTKFLLNKKNKN